MKKRLRSTSSTLVLLGTIVFGTQGMSAIYQPGPTPADLIQAILDALNTSEDDTVDLQGRVYRFLAGCATTHGGMEDTCGDDYTALPVIDGGNGKLVIINGTIERSSTSLNLFRLIEVGTMPQGDLTLVNISLRNGYAPEVVVNNLSSLKKKDDLRIFASMEDGNGGAIRNAGSLKLINTNISNSTAELSGGGIYNDTGANLSIQSSNISTNLSLMSDPEGTDLGGGGIYNDGTILTISNTTIARNISKAHGGGINNHGILNHLFRSVIFNNSACDVDIPGAECPDADQDPASGNGGGIYNDSDSTVLQITNCTISDNTALMGGGIYNDATNFGEGLSIFNADVPDQDDGVYIYNTTISANNASFQGGGIYNSDNTSSEEGPATINTLVSTIVAGNTDFRSINDLSDPAPDIYDGNYLDGDQSFDFVFEEYNLIGEDSGNFFADVMNHDIVGDNVNPVNPALGPLQDNGGFTFTMELLPLSPAINQGLNPYSLDYDQRASPYRRVKCSRPDIGAFERQTCF